MSYQPIEKLLSKANYSIYTLVRMAAKRAMDLADGKPSLITNPSSKKIATIAMEEIIAGKIHVKGHAQSTKGDKKSQNKSQPELEEQEQRVEV